MKTLLKKRRLSNVNNHELLQFLKFYDYKDFNWKKLINKKNY